MYTAAAATMRITNTSSATIRSSVPGPRSNRTSVNAPAAQSSPSTMRNTTLTTLLPRERGWSEQPNRTHLVRKWPSKAAGPAEVCDERHSRRYLADERAVRRHVRGGSARSSTGPDDTDRTAEPSGEVAVPGALPAGQDDQPVQHMNSARGHDRDDVRD